MTLIDPFTGELLDADDLHELEHVEVDLDRYLRNFGPLYGLRDEIRGRIAELRGQAVLPWPRNRSDIQARVSKCPRCMAKSGS